MQIEWKELSDTVLYCLVCDVTVTMWGKYLCHILYEFGLMLGILHVTVGLQAPF